MQKLTKRITTVFALLFILYSFLFSFITVSMTNHVAQDEARRSMEETNQVISRNCSNLTSQDLVDNTESWQEAQKAIMNGLNPVERVSIYDVNGREILAYGNRRLTDVSLEEETTSRMTDKQNQYRLVHNGDQAVYEYAGSLENGRGQPVAYIRILRMVYHNPQLERRLLVYTGLVSLAAVVILLLILRFYTRRIAFPIRSITEVVDQLSEGNYEVSYQPAGIEEFDEIGEDVNQLARNLDVQTGQLTLQEERLRLLIDYLVVGVLMIDRKGRIQVANQSVYTILGINEDLTGKSYQEAIEGYRLVEMISRCFDSKKTINDEIYLYYPKELVLNVNVVYVPSDQALDQDDQVIVLIYDVTEIRHLEKVRSDFISNASHELKTPVTSIRGFSETLLDGAVDDPDTAREFVEIINKESNRLGSLISDILDLAKIEQDHTPGHLEDVHLDEVVEDVFESQDKTARENQISLSLENLDGKPLVFEGEPGRINQIITNLVNNAIKYNRPGGHVWVRIWTNESGQYATIEVKDDGIGIPQEDQPRIFERFYRVSKDRSTATGGTGLGLSIVRNLVESMHGTISLSSDYGKGTVFTVVLPLNREDQEKEESEEDNSADLDEDDYES